MKDFSVIISIYNGDNPEYFKVAIDSILNQTIAPNEIVLIVDGPVSDELVSIIGEYQQSCKCFRPIFLEKNVGLGNALRIAVEVCSYNLIARMDSDDIAVNDRFEKQVIHFELDDSLGILGGAISEFIGNPHNIIGKRVVPITDSEIRNYLKRRCPFNHVTVMFKKDEVVKAGNYQDWFLNEDYSLWIRMLESGCKFGNIPDVLVRVRIDNETYKRRGGQKYFLSEAKLQKYMFEKKIIGLAQLIMNVLIRFVIQILMPNYLRGLFIRTMARN